MNILYSRINDTVLPAGEASLPISDMAIQRGYGIFDFFKIVNHKPVFLDDHLDRFFTSASTMRLVSPLSREALTQAIHDLIQKNNLADAGMRITLTGGSAADGYSIHHPALLLVQQPLQLAAHLQPGIHLVTYEHQRQLPHVKTIDYLMAVWLQDYIREHGATDVLYQQQGHITECPRANFFIVNKENELVTPAQYILPGITRKKILELAGRKMVIRESAISSDDLLLAKEAFITSTTKHVLPVLRIDDRAIGDGQPGPVTKMLFDDIVQLVNAG